MYKAILKDTENNLNDSSHAPHTVHNKTDSKLETRVLQVRKQTGYEPLRIKEELEELEQISLSQHTIRHFLRRNKDKIRLRSQKTANKTKCQFVNWYSAKAFEVVQMDLKFIGGQKALSMEQIHHIHTKNLSLYQWIAIDVHSRFRLMGYSYEKSWTNGLAWIFWVLSWLGSHGVQSQTFFTVDRGEAFGGKFWFKICKLRKLLSDFGYTFIQNRVGHPEDPPHIECSHQTDDEAFYIPQLLSIASKKKSFF